MMLMMVPEVVGAPHQSPLRHRCVACIQSVLGAWVGPCFPSPLAMINPLAVGPWYHHTEGTLLCSMGLGSHIHQMSLGSFG
jgi:hypothetical protein